MEVSLPYTVHTCLQRDVRAVLAEDTVPLHDDTTTGFDTGVLDVTLGAYAPHTD